MIAPQEQEISPEIDYCQACLREIDPQSFAVLAEGFFGENGFFCNYLCISVFKHLAPNSENKYNVH